MSKLLPLEILIAILLFIIGIGHALADGSIVSGTPIEHIVAPGGNVVYYIMSFPDKDSVNHKKLQIVARNKGNSSSIILLTAQPSNNPKENLDDFSKLLLSPDGKTLYFESTAWVTEDAIHALDITTKKASYITSGEIACVVLGGEYQGDLIVQQHKYFIQGGSYDALYLYDTKGHEVGIVSQNTDASKVCPLLGS